MKKKKLLIGLTLGLAACGHADDDAAPPGPDRSASSTEQAPPADGYTRFSPPPIEVESGKDETWCQWVAGPAEADMDVMDVTGEQTFPGHHTLLFATSEAQPVGTSRRCVDTELVGMKILGGVGGEGGANLFPRGAVLRLKKGESLMMNDHYLNTSDKKVIGRSTLDVKFAPPSPDHILASVFLNSGKKFTLTPQSESSAVVTCVLPHDIKLLDFANHMHEFGTKVSTEEIHRSGETNTLKRDDTWAPEWQFNPPRQRWSVDAPHVLKAGDTLRTRCTWKNTTPGTLTFPREMCIGAGFMLAENDVSCVDGEWKEQGR